MSVKHSSVQEPPPTSPEIELYPDTHVVRWRVYNASGTLVATYPDEAAAKAHCDSWASGLYYRGS